MKFDLSRFKKIKHDEHTTTLQHPDGHTITLAHKPLHPKLREALASLPVSHAAASGKKVEEAPQENAKLPKKAVGDKPVKMAEGGQAPEVVDLNLNPQLPGFIPGVDSNTPSDRALNAAYTQQRIAEEQAKAAEQAKADSGSSFGSDFRPKSTEQMAADAKAKMLMEGSQQPSAGQPIPGATPGMPQLPTMAQQVSQPTEQPKPAEQQPDAAKQQGKMDFSTPDLLTGYKAGMAGIGQQQAAESKLAQANAQIHKESEDFHKGLQEDFNKASLEYKNNMDSAIKAFRDQKLDYNRVWSNQNTGQRIMTTIALALGGLGAGAAGGENQAMKVLNGIIERDVQQQKDELGQKNNLVSYYAKKFNDVQQGITMAKAIQTQVIADKLGEAAARAGTPMAQAKANMLRSELIKGMAPEWYSMTMRQAMMNRMEADIQGQGGNADPVAVSAKKAAMAIPILVPPAEREAASKELEEWQKTEIARKTYLDSMQQLKKMFLSGTVLPWNRDRRAAEVNALAGKLTQINEKRFNWEASKNMAEGMFPTAWSGFGDNFDEKIRKGMQVFDGMTPTPRLKGYGIPLPENAAQRASGSERKALEWARANANSSDPMQRDAAAKVLKKFEVR